MIGFNVPIYIKESIDCIKEAAESRKICGDGAFTKKCSEWMENKFNAHKVLMTTSCTSALEMAAILLDLKPGDEVIMPSYTFVSTADAFVMVGAKVVFVDVNPDTMNIDEEKIKEAITDKTKAIAVVHYAGISPDMDKVMKIAKEHNLKVVEDAAQGFMAKYMTREEFFHILLRQRQSNLTVKDFCANEGYNRSQFYDWRSRFNISDEELKSGSVPTAGMDGFVPISIDNNNVSAPTFQSKPALCPQKTEKTSGKCTDNSEISLELPNGIKMKFKGTGGCKAALSLLTKLCGTCFA